LTRNSKQELSYRGEKASCRMQFGVQTSLAVQKLSSCASINARCSFVTCAIAGTTPMNQITKKPFVWNRLYLQKTVVASSSK